SRYTGWGTLARLLPVAGLDRQESIALLSAQVPHIPPATADELATEIGDLPLAAAQAAAFLAQTGMPATRYLSLLRTRRADLLARDDIGERGGSVRTAVELSMARLREESPAAAGVLELASCFGHAPIPLDLLRSHPTMFAEPLRSVIADELAFAVALAALTRYSLATLRGEDLEVHRLVQDVLRNALPEPAQDALERQIEAMLGATEPGNPENPASWPGFARLRPHVLAAKGGADAGFRRLTLDCGRYLLARGDAASCLRLADDAAARYDVALGPLADDTLAAMHLAALASWKLGDNARSFELNQAVFAALRDKHGGHHPMTLASANNLAISLGSVGRHDEAARLASETLAARQLVLGEQNPATLASVTTVIALLIGIGEIEEARVDSEDLLAQSRKLLGPDHPSTLVAEHNLAVVLAQLGEYEPSVALGEDVLARRQRVLGEQHPDTLRSMHNLAIGLAALGRSAPAQQLAEQAAEGLAGMLGENHPETVRARRLASGEVDPSGEHPAPEPLPS
ncbi:MAG: FxSxx-COOH system tetratricopeptide repeat protein, partial [Pseudonocardiaceae bacterium]